MYFFEYSSSEISTRIGDISREISENSLILIKSVRFGADDYDRIVTCLNAPAVSWVEYSALYTFAF